MRDDLDTIDYLRKSIQDKSSGVDLPAAIILETVQGEGGVNVASVEWLREVEAICRDFDILLIIDDIQVGNGRTGKFFSFEEAGLNPDIITLSKSIGGGLPLSIVLLKPELDHWKPGEHTGTFRGNNLAFVASTQALSYWDNDHLETAIAHKSGVMKEHLQKIVDEFDDLNLKLRGRGMIFGLECVDQGFASDVAKECFNNKLIMETSGADENVLKFLPPLVIEEEELIRGIKIVRDSIKTVLDQKKQMVTGGM